MQTVADIDLVTGSSSMIGESVFPGVLRAIHHPSVGELGPCERGAWCAGRYHIVCITRL